MGKEERWYLHLMFTFIAKLKENIRDVANSDSSLPTVAFTLTQKTL